jgi:beta-aspartyl-peptidase (threonine type)
VILEDSGAFNAGSGARLQLDGAARLDASLMEGASLRAGAVAGLEGIRNAISAARLVMERTPHVLLMGAPARRLARLHGLRAGRRAAERLAQVRAQRRGGGPLVELARRLQKDTVGAVALDRNGLLAAGVSTGGITWMLPGRVGDSPIVGAGVYAENAGGAAALTGDGEGIIRMSAAKEITMALFAGQTPSAAARRTLRKMRERTQKTGGALVLDARGRLALVHTTDHLLGGYRVGQRARIGDRFDRV